MNPTVSLVTVVEVATKVAVVDGVLAVDGVALEEFWGRKWAS